MKSLIVFITMALSVSAFAETATFIVEGMHCGGCKKMVTKAVCNDKKIAEMLSECKVTVDEKTQIGTVIITAKESKKIDDTVITAAIQSAGEDYKISKKEIAK